MKLFKLAFKLKRENDKAIYKGFGFSHLSDATQYYVHPDNQSINGTTTLAQPIGEAIVFFSALLMGLTKEAETPDFPQGDYWVNEHKNEYFLAASVPADWRENKVIDADIFAYKAHLKGDKITVGAYDAAGNFLPGAAAELMEHYKILPAFAILCARELERTRAYRDFMERFLEDPTPDLFVNLNEDLYQLHKLDNYNLLYAEPGEPVSDDFTSFSASYEIVRSNKKALLQENDVAAIGLPPEEFSAEQRALIPALSAEFVLPKKLLPLANALATGDVRTVLFHGPAGTGKTISCKLLCQASGLPIMETINCTENLDEFVLGKFIPEGNKIIFKESYVTKAIRDGGAVVFEEINFAKPQYLAFLNSLLDDNGFVRLDNGEVVHRHKNFRFLATMNLGYFGTKELNQALYNRFNAIIELAALSDAAITRMLLSRVPECRPVLKNILSVYHKLKKKIEAEELDAVISPRNLENWARLAKYEGYIPAAEKSIIPIARCDRLLEQAIRGILLLYKG